MSMIVYKGPSMGKVCHGPAGHEYAFARGVPREVPDDFAARIMSNNPEPWQLKMDPEGFDVFELVADKPKGKSKGGEG